jgi:PIN domain nuclease of toxin-antitoxin system
MSDLFVIDTHALVFWAGNKPSKLGRSARHVFERYEAGSATLYIPAPVALEVWLLCKNGTLSVASFGGWWSKYCQGRGLIHLDLTSEDIVAAADLDWSHEDVFDRLIVATALRVGCPLVTKDRRISEWGGVDVLW